MINVVDLAEAVWLRWRRGHDGPEWWWHGMGGGVFRCNACGFEGSMGANGQAHYNQHLFNCPELKVHIAAALLQGDS